MFHPTRSLPNPRTTVNRNLGVLLSLCRLEALSELETLDLTGTQVTEAGVKRLLKALPQLLVWPRQLPGPSVRLEPPERCPRG